MMAESDDTRWLCGHCGEATVDASVPCENCGEVLCETCRQPDPDGETGAWLCPECLREWREAAEADHAGLRRRRAIAVHAGSPAEIAGDGDTGG